VSTNLSIAVPVRSKLVVTIAALLLLAPLAASAQSVDVAHTGQTFTVRYTATFSPDELRFGQAFGYDTIGLSDGALVEPGKPLLPTQTVHIALPAGMSVTDVRVTNAETVDLPGEYVVLPAQPPRRISESVTAADFVTPDQATYASSAPYPAQMVRFVQECDLAGQALAVVELRPVQYRPAERKLSLCTSITLALEGVSGYVCGDYLPLHMSAAGLADREREVASLVVNPDDVALQTNPHQAGQRGVAPGDYDYVIITTTDWVSAFQPLADWKTKKGVPANIVTLTWIYSTYTGSNQDKIKAFVQDAYNNWGTTYFLMGGDTSYVPCHSHSFPSVDYDPVPNDTYYADFDADWVVEVNVGRASVNNTGNGPGGIGAFINKIMTFEKNPPTSDYPRKAGLFGFDLDGNTHTEQAKADIANSYLPPSTWNVTAVYDSQTTNHYTAAMAAMNAGQMLINHSDHSNNDVMGVGYINHGWLLSEDDMDSLTNGNRQSVLYSLGCDACSFDVDNCIAEHFVRNVNGGGIAFIGNSRYGWFNSGDLNSLNLLYDKYFFRSLVQQGWYHLGAAVADHKNDYFPSDDYYKYIWTELTLLGDPELPVWTAVILNFSATYPASVYVGAPASFTVHVANGSYPISGARVCLWKPGDIYLIQQTNTSGDATFSFTPGSTGTLNVTVTRQNYLPYEGTASVVENANYSLTVNVVGQGSVVLNPPGGTYPANSTVQLTADADASWHFDHWAGDLSGSTNPATLVMDDNKTVTATFGRVGDMNCDGVVDFSDINPFVLAVTDQAQYQATYPNCFLLNADINLDGVVDFGDINPFVGCLTSGQCP
jgi:hypothetical protein